MKCKQITIVVICLLVMFSPLTVFGDVIFLKDQTFYSGKVMVDSPFGYMIQDDQGKKHSFKCTEVLSVLYGADVPKKSKIIFSTGEERMVIVVKDNIDHFIVTEEPGKPYEKVMKKDLKNMKNSFGKGSFNARQSTGKKKEGWYFTGAPLIGYSEENGFRGGGRLYFYNNGTKGSDPYFDVNPHGMKAYLQVTASTKERFEGKLFYDWKNIKGSPFGFTIKLDVDKRFNNLYFGTGSSTTSNPLTDNTSNTYTTYDDYASAFLSQSQYQKYNNYQSLDVAFRATMNADIGKYWKAGAGYKFMWDQIIDWSTEGYTTLLGSEQPLGYNGGFISALTGYVMLDLRDFPADPKEGIMLYFGAEGALDFLGSTYTYVKTDWEARFFYTFFDYLTVAFRVAYYAGSQDIPFYLRYDLGGDESLRGFLGHRFAGNTVTLFNLEVRFTTIEFILLGQRFGIKLVGFFDAGNAYSSFQEPFTNPRFEDYKIDGGVGVIGTWNRSTVMHFYAGFSSEDIGLSISFGHIF